MSLSTILPQSASSTSVVYEYTLSVRNFEDNDTQELTAAFTSIPTVLDWQNWLTGWFSCGYSLVASPALIRVI